MKRFVAIVRIAAKQKRRDLFALALSLLTAPLFVVFYWTIFHDNVDTYRIDMLDQYGKTQENAAHIQRIENALSELSTQHNGYSVSFSKVRTKSEAIENLKRGDVDMVLVFSSPPITSQNQGDPPPIIIFMGNASSPRFQFCAALSEKQIALYSTQRCRAIPSVVFQTEALGVSATKTPFESYVPGLLVFAVIMLIFSSAMSIVKDIEAGTFARLRMTPVSAFELLGALSLVQLFTGIVSVLLTFIAAWLLGFKSEGSILLAMVIATIACMASVGIGMVIAGLSKNQGRAFLLSSIAMFLLVLFSGIVFPRPNVPVFEVGNQVVDLFDILPTTHLGSALDKVLTLGAGAGDVIYEICVLLFISLITYIIGSLLFIRSGKPATTTWEGML